ncbi:hypothetical protein MCOR25_009557 [Pyricularia grisea]|nr:hypothetical protein MCOR25_009557 [Pyricularia grisea]
MSTTTNHISANGQTPLGALTATPPSTGSSHAYAAAIALGPAMPWSGEAYKAMTSRKSGHYAKKPQHKTTSSSSSSGWRSLLKSSSASKKKKAAAAAEAHAAAEKLGSDDESVY